ncbi:hypothetical protein DFH08DRAFT_312583 [Mycena albidolilacea]|uniref:NmrA-like domain-containing protein n=1 Tax=Mycena albidolilacea TaxID=1033008 RepID=A0AAD7EJ72_9AGAR|nr:hypothetical protein DFH08DRAFT_312583 [Mycena albidolilacea]
MSSSRIVSVFGATGQQGASVVQSLLKDGTFSARAITRDPKSEAALKLQQQGAEVVQADTVDKASLVNALRGSEAVFMVTLSTFPPYSPEKPSEITVGKNIIDAAKELTGGKYTQVSLYDDKEVIEEYLKASGIVNASLHLGSFTENLWTQKQLKKTDTSLNITVAKFTPTARQSFTWVGHDVGESALALLKNYTDSSKNISGKTYPVVTANMSFPDLATIISKALGKDVTFTSIPSTGHPVFDEMCAAQTEYNGFYTSTPIPNPDLTALGAKFGTIEEFVETELKKRYQ